MLCTYFTFPCSHKYVLLQKVLQVVFPLQNQSIPVDYHGTGDVEQPVPNLERTDALDLVAVAKEYICGRRMNHFGKY